jgi:hypothetical protein
MAGELFLRLFVPSSRLEFVVDEELLWRNRPNQLLRLPPSPDGNRTRVISTDERGYRCTVSIPTSGARRILVLGDSHVFGTGLSDIETFCSQLQARVGEKYKVINAGVPGWGMFQMDILLRRIIETARPEIVIVFFCSGDVTRQPFPPDQPQRKAAFLRQSRFIYAVRHYTRLGSLVGHMIQWIVLRRTNRGVINDVVDDHRGDAPSMIYRQCLERDRARLAAMKVLTDRYGAKLFLLIGSARDHIHLAAGADKKVVSFFLGEMKAICKELGIIGCEGPADVERYSSDDLMLPNDTHPSPLWNRLSAEAACKVLDSAKLLTAEGHQ